MAMTNRNCLPEATDDRAWPRSLAAALFLCLALVIGPAAADAASKGAAPRTDEALIKGAGLAADDVGYLVVDLADKRVVTEHNPDQPFAPASVAKIATFAAALEILGGDHRFTTTLDAKGVVADGVLTGSLILRGGGDPSLTGDDLQAMAKQLAASGITRVDGTFVYDATATVELSQIDAKQPQAVDYNCGVSALSLNYNRVRIRWQKNGTDRSVTAIAASKNVMLPLDGVGATFADENLARALCAHRASLRGSLAPVGQPAGKRRGLVAGRQSIAGRGRRIPGRRGG